MSNHPLLEPGYYYHIYNRANGSENLFREETNYNHFLNLYDNTFHRWQIPMRGCFILLNDFKSIIMENFYYVYVLFSLKDQKLYTGYSKDLKSRFDSHQSGHVPSTKNRRPLKLIYYEGCLNQQDATHREKYLKTFHGKMFLRNRLKNWYEYDQSNLI